MLATMTCSLVHVGRFYNTIMRQKAAKNSRLLECDAVLLGEDFQRSKGSQHLHAEDQGGQKEHHRSGCET